MKNIHYKGLQIIDKLELIVKWTHPVWLLAFILISIFYFLIVFWEEVIWSNKRWYFQAYDFWAFKRRVKKGLTDREIKNCKLWIKKNSKFSYIPEMKQIIKEQENAKN
jgi:hypothetical protein